MRKILLALTIAIAFVATLPTALSQVRLWERGYCYLNGNNLWNPIIPLDSNNMLVVSSSSSLRVPGFINFRFPIVWKFNGAGAIVDSFHIRDTVDFNNFLIRKWNDKLITVGREILPRTRSFYFSKYSLEGELIEKIRHNLRDTALNYMPNLGLVSDMEVSDNSFYTGGIADALVFGQNIRAWNISRWDTSGNRMWQRFYYFRYALNVLYKLSFDIDGQLLAVGISGPDRHLLKIDTANGDIIWRRNLGTDERGRQPFNFNVVRIPNAYVVSYERIDTIRNWYEIICYPLDSTQAPFFRTRTPQSINEIISMTDSSFYILNNGPAGQRYTRLKYDSTILSDFNFHASNSDPNTDKNVFTVAHYSNGDIFCAGTFDNDTAGWRLYVTRLAYFGEPFNPTYPPVWNGPPRVRPTPVGVKPKELEVCNTTWLIYPNPSSGTFQSDKAGYLQIFNALGARVFAQTIEDGQNLDFSNLSTGLYVVKLSNKEGQYTQKWVRE